MGRLKLTRSRLSLAASRVYLKLKILQRLKLQDIGRQEAVIITNCQNTSAKEDFASS